MKNIQINKPTPILFTARSVPWVMAFSEACRVLTEQRVPVMLRWHDSTLWSGFAGESTFTIEEPEPVNYHDLDELFAQQWYNKSLTEYGIKIPPEALAGPHSYARIARALVQSIIGLDYDPRYSFPTTPRNGRVVDGIVLNEEERPAVEAFLKGYGIENPVIESFIDHNDMDTVDILTSARIKCIGINANNPHVTTLIACYTGYDNMSSNPVSLSRDVPVEDHRLVTSFATHLLYTDDERGLKAVEQTGTIWKNRDKYNHSHVEYLKKRAK